MLFAYWATVRRRNPASAGWKTPGGGCVPPPTPGALPVPVAPPLPLPLPPPLPIRRAGTAAPGNHARARTDQGAQGKGHRKISRQSRRQQPLPLSLCHGETSRAGERARERNASLQSGGNANLLTWARLGPYLGRFGPGQPLRRRRRAGHPDRRRGLCVRQLGTRRRRGGDSRQVTAPSGTPDPYSRDRGCCCYPPTLPHQAKTNHH